MFEQFLIWIEKNILTDNPKNVSADKIRKAFADFCATAENSITAAGSGLYPKSITPTSSIPSDLNDGVILVTEPGTYTNFGNVILPQEFFGFIFKNGNSFTLQTVRLPIQDLTAIEEEVSNKLAIVDFKAVSTIGNYIPFELKAGDLGVNGIPNTSLNWLRTGRVNCEYNAQYTIIGMGQNGSTLGVRRVYFYNGTTFLSFVGSQGSETFTFTTPENCSNFIVQIDGVVGIANDIPNSPYWDKFRISKGSTIVKPSIKGESVSGDIRTPQILNIISEIENRLSYEQVDSLINIVNLLPFTLKAGYIDINNAFNNSVNWIRTDYINVEPNKKYYIKGYGNLSGVVAITHRVVFYTSTNVVIPMNLGDVSEFTTPANCYKVIVNIAGVANAGADVPNSPYWQTFKISDEEIGGGNYLKAESLKGEIQTEQLQRLEQSANLLNENIEVQVNSLTISLTSGAVTTSKGTSGAVGYNRTTVSNSANLPLIDISKKYYYSGEIQTNQSSIAGILYLDANLNLLGFDCENVGIYEDYLLKLPANTMYLATCSYGTPIIKEGVAKLKGSDSYNIVNIDPSITTQTANNFNNIADAFASVKGSTKFVFNGEFRETLPFNVLPSGEYELVNKTYNKTRFLGSKKLVGWTKTDGYNNIYEILYTDSVLTWSRYKKPIFEDKNPSFQILPDERHPLQKGLSNRLPFTILEEASSLENLDLNKGVFYADGKIYIHASNSTNPNENGFSYEMINLNVNTYPSTSSGKRIKIKMSDLQFMFYNEGLRFINFDEVIRHNVTVLGVRGAGAFRDDVGRIISYNDEAGACNGDGFNGHFSSSGNYQALTDNRSMEPHCIYFNPWAHDCKDDGISHHENHRVSIYGVLTEYNEDGGIRASNDSGYTIYNGLARGNGFGPEASAGGNGGEGLSVVNPTINTNRNGCKVVAYNFISENNNCGFASISDAQNLLVLYDCVTRNNNSELYTTAGKIISNNTRVTNPNINKHKVIKGGQIIIKNDSLLQ